MSETSISGSAITGFSPVFAGFAVGQQSCPCGFLGGATSFSEVEVMISDDPNLASECSEGSAPYQQLGTYHYLELQVISTSGAVAPGTYAELADPTSSSAAFGSISMNDPTPGGGYQYISQADGGTIQLSEIGAVVSGAFAVTGLHEDYPQDGGGQGPALGNVSGSFVATPCAAPAESILRGLGCGCPG